MAKFLKLLLVKLPFYVISILYVRGEQRASRDIIFNFKASSANKININKQALNLISGTLHSDNSDHMTFQIQKIQILKKYIRDYSPHLKK